MLEVSNRTGTDISVMTSAADLRLSLFCTSQQSLKVQYKLTLLNRLAWNMCPLTL